MKIASKLVIPQLNMQKIFLVLFAVSAIICMNPYFLWKTYKNGMFTSVLNIVMILNLMGLVVYAYLFVQKIKMREVFVCLMLVLLGVYMYYVGEVYHPGFSMGSIVIICSICLFIVLDRESQAYVFSVFTLLFAIAILPSIIAFLFRIASIELPMQILQSEHLGKILLGKYYEQYFGGLLIIVPSTNEIRLCGIFDEPGVVGTFAALILAADGLKFRMRIRNFIILLGGILSLSMAFYILLFGIIMMRAYFNGYKKFIKIVLVILIGVILFFSIETDNKYVLQVKSRFVTEDELAIKDNRTSSSFDTEYQSFLNSNNISKWLGNGLEANIKNEKTYGGSSYKNLIYNFGIVGFIIYIGWIVQAELLLFGFNKKHLIFLAIFLLSIYQRPDVFRIPYMFVFFGALATLSIDSRGERSKEELIREANA